MQRKDLRHAWWAPLTCCPTHRRFRTISNDDRRDLRVRIWIDQRLEPLDGEVQDEHRLLEAVEQRWNPALVSNAKKASFESEVLVKGFRDQIEVSVASFRQKLKSAGFKSDLI